MSKNVQMTFHHIGKTVNLAKIKDNPATKFSELFDMYSLDMKNSLSLPIELHAFGPNSSLDKRIQSNPHIAFKVDYMEAALENEEIIMPLYQPFSGYRCAMIWVNEQPIELIETQLSEEEIWGDGIF